MRPSVVFLVSLSACATSGLAGPVSLFEDTFDTENGGTGTLNYDGWAQWTVSDGTVDLIGNGFNDLLPSNGLYVDLDGSTANSGLFQSVEIDLDPGLYELRFELGGSQRGGSDTATVTLGDYLNESFTLQSDEPFQLITRSFEVVSADTVRIAFQNAGGDDAGLLLDDVGLTLVPAPASVAVLVLAAAGLRRRDRAR